ncbi:SIR2 family NAD-dependent protein deacylase [Vibrio anguillarum]|uniref:SIR2 family NAD-dependent protein deacylase n=1 Tax=Vibrio anguillarum TaxID=55601 RepID=UPI0002F2DE99|nr:Sir2 family NAD-dependent protein deacetylase [Vibrio anguillarum]OEE32803.1 hypothetical protein A1QW_02120 [Vibrio anguillarum]
MHEQLDLEYSYGKAAELILGAKHLLITAGAGMGVDSGLPVFRGNDGFYDSYAGFEKASINFANVANPHFLLQSPKAFWWFYGQRFELYNQSMPHWGYQIIKSWLYRKDGFVFTSNVDGHFEKIGIAKNKIVECHGSIHFLQCSINCCSSLWRIEVLPFSLNKHSCDVTGPLPECPNCGNYARPAIHMFNDAQWNGVRTSLQWDRFDDWQYSIEAKHLIVVEIGAGQAIPTIRIQSEKLGTPIIRINTANEDAYVENGVSLPVSALAALEGIQRHLVQRAPQFASAV